MDKRLRSFKEIKKRTNLTFFGWSWKNDHLFTKHQILWTSLINTIVFKERTSLQRKFWKNDRFISKRQILLIERFYKWTILQKKQFYWTDIFKNERNK